MGRGACSSGAWAHAWSSGDLGGSGIGFRTPVSKNPEPNAPTHVQRQQWEWWPSLGRTRRCSLRQWEWWPSLGLGGTRCCSLRQWEWWPSLGTRRCSLRQWERWPSVGLGGTRRCSLQWQLCPHLRWTRPCGLRQWQRHKQGGTLVCGGGQSPAVFPKIPSP